MKKIPVFLLGLVVGALLMFSTSSYAADAIEKITAALSPQVSVTLDGQKVELKNTPINYKDTNYLPVRDISSALGLGVEWDEKTQTVKLESSEEAGGGNEASTPAPTPTETPAVKDTKTSNDEQSNENVYVSWMDLIKVADKNKGNLTGTVKDSKPVIIYNGVTYTMRQFIDTIFDTEDNKFINYEMALKVFPKEDVDSLQKFKVDPETYLSEKIK